MSTTPLADQFREAQHNINLNGRRRTAIAAHLEVRAVLKASSELVAHGLNDVLIGSYPRDTAIWPGKDVDVFAKLTGESINTISPNAAYAMFWNVLVKAFDDRVSEQARSVKVAYRPGALPGSTFLREAATLLKESTAQAPADAFDFSVDVVAAVHFGSEWAIPNHDRETWTRTAHAERWTRTNPERLTQLSRDLNGEAQIQGQGIYVPTVKAVRQIRRNALGDAKPGGLYFELLLFEGFTQGAITGDTWAEATSSALDYLAARLSTVGTTPLCDPALNTPYEPAPDPGAIAHAALVFDGLAVKARSALVADPCPAAAAWREIFGSNTQANGPVFPLPQNCREDGTLIPLISTANVLRGSNEAHGFGDT